MKIAAYNYRDFDEAKYFEKFGQEYGVEIVICREAPNRENAHLAEGCVGVSVITTEISEDLIRIWKEMGVKHISTRTIGYDHIDLDAARKYGMTVSNVSYSTGSVADYTVMIILMALRRMKTILRRADGQDYSLKGSIGREIGDLTVGVVGTGKIGEHVIRNLSGFGCRILASDPYEKESVRKYASYVSKDELFQLSDVITFHTPALPETYHMVNEETLKEMKDGVILVNAARGSIIDTEALIKALESKKVGAAALDVVENELGIFYGDYKYQVIGHRQISILKDMPNVLFTPHMAFYTEQAVSDMVEHSIESIVAEASGGVSKSRVI
ncbi:MAG: D-isomer specific 2-hydroxyacid dehydrogenase family protein [Fusicatenibacter sp.]|nr:D-isomer specific 2-hydroxyacid dehydrogenase family protein [Lachnospiraceae bacterium]MDY2938690.1 D-isomer specific 2-hydroxyacid dehydrogenase family protein [Fusicatenibacter sp.]